MNNVCCWVCQHDSSDVEMDLHKKQSAGWLAEIIQHLLFFPCDAASSLVLDNKKREQTRIYRASAIAISKIRNSKMTDPRQNVCTPNIFWILYTYELPRRTWKLTGGVTTYAPLDAYYCHSGETKVVFSFNTSAGEKRITAFFSIFCLLRIVVLILKQGLIQHSSTLYV